ncbi:MAG: tetratricopeptide repeat protein [Planctomycetota bacterium]
MAAPAGLGGREESIERLVMMTGLKMAAALALCAVVWCAGCYNPPVEKMKSRQAMDAGDYTSAEQRLVGVVDNDPSDWEGRYLLGLAYLGQDRPVEAQSQLELALAVKDRSPTQTPKILDALARSLEQQASYDQLYAFLDAQIERYEGWEDYARKARFLAKANDVDGAALAYRQAAFFSRNETEDIYLEIADFYKELGDYPKAVQALKWAYYINDENTSIPNRFRVLGVVPGPTLKEAPPQPEYAGATLFGIPIELP